MSDTTKMHETQHNRKNTIWSRTRRHPPRQASSGNPESFGGETKEGDSLDGSNDSRQGSPIRTRRDSARVHKRSGAMTDEDTESQEFAPQPSLLTITEKPKFWGEPPSIQFGLVLEGSDQVNLVGRQDSAEIDLQPGTQSRTNTQFSVSQNGAFRNGVQCPGEIQTDDVGHCVKLETGTIAIHRSVHFWTKTLLTIRVHDMKRSGDSWTYDVPESGEVRVKFHFVLDSYFDSFAMRSLFLVLLWVESLVVSDSEYRSLSKISPYRIMKSQFFAREYHHSEDQPTQHFIRDTNAEEKPQVLEFKKLLFSPDMTLFLLGTLRVAILHWALSGGFQLSVVMIVYASLFMRFLFHPQIAQGQNTVDISTAVLQAA